MTHIVFEDEELEEFVLSGESDIALPISVALDSAGDCTITVYSAYKNEAEKFEKLYGDDPLSDDAKEYIDRVFSPIVRKLGYRFEREFDQTVVSYEVKDGKVNDVSCDADVRIIKTNDELEKLYLHEDIELSDGDPADVLCAVVIDDVMVSRAGVNDYSDNGSLEINVVTEKEFRGRGYGSAAVAGLCKYLTSLGERVSYKCRKSNAASRRVAEKTGLVVTGTSYYYVCYKKD